MTTVEKSLTSENVHRLFMDSLFQTDPTELQKEKAVRVMGITQNVGFDPDRLGNNKEELKKILLCLPSEFMESNGVEGGSFLAACVDNTDTEWGEHTNIQQLMLMSIGCKLMKYTSERIQWRNNLAGV